MGTATYQGFLETATNAERQRQFFFILFLFCHHPNKSQEQALPTPLPSQPTLTDHIRTSTTRTDIQHSTPLNASAKQRSTAGLRVPRQSVFSSPVPPMALISKGGQPSATSKGGPETDQKETTNSKFQRADAHLKGCVETGEPGSPVTTITAYYARTKCAYALVRSMQYALIS